MASGSRPACSEPEKRRDVPAARSPDNTLYPPLKSLFTAPRRGNYSAAEETESQTGLERHEDDSWNQTAVKVSR
ncbi:hypothetical protein R3I94_020901 [Phoxinus phoxinus]